MSAQSENTRPQPIYFVNAWVDFSLIGGISIALFLILYKIGYRSRASSITLLGYTYSIILLAQQLAWVCNWPHFSATNHRLYHSWDNIRQYPMTALLIPWLVLAGIISSLTSPTTIAPYFIKLFLIWSPYHFSGQTLGITLIYARRCGFVVGKIERLALSGFIFGTFVTQLVRSEVDPTTLQYYGIEYLTLGLPKWTVPAVEGIMYFSGIIFLLFALRWSVRNRRMLPLILLLPAVTQYIWFVASSAWPSFMEFVPFFHSLQYFLIAWSMQLKEKLDREHIRPSTSYVVSESMRWWGLNFIGGASLFFVFPYAVEHIFHLQKLFTLGVIISGVQIHHFFVDGVIWKLKRKTVSSPLMGNLSELLGPPRQQISQATS